MVDNINGVEKPRLLIYDIMLFENSSDVMLCHHQRRLLCAEKELIQPREEAVSYHGNPPIIIVCNISCLQAAAGSLNKQTEPFSVRFKQFWDVSETRMVYNL